MHRNRRKSKATATSSAPFGGLFKGKDKETAEMEVEDGAGTEPERASDRPKKKVRWAEEVGYLSLTNDGLLRNGVPRWSTTREIAACSGL